ncbi:MAG: NADH-quinone oxidoreductase subunit H, partial [Cellulomonas sp.]|nr:NADH-quinone oxidoreductase subunit H [Cellulomonas sp.]
MSGPALLLALVQVLVAVAFAPLVVGVTRQTRARLEGRAGPGVLQPWRDLRKLLAKTPLRAAGTSVVTVAAPLVLLVSSLLLAALVPSVGAVPVALVPGDLFVVVSVLLLGTV